MSLCVYDFSLTSLLRTAVSIFIYTLVYIHNVSGRVIAYPGIIYCFVFYSTRTVPWTIVGMIVRIPIIVVSVIIVIIVRCPWLPVGRVITVVPG